ncbi:MAG: hypothetical protein V3V49_03590 [Candidatus Krumholzibacteria bacterium]
MNLIRKTLSVMLLLAVLPAPGAAFTLRRAPSMDYAAEEPREPAPGAVQMLPGSDGGENKSIGRAILYSLALPGLGHRYLGRAGMARMFYVAEGAVWTSFVAFEVQGRLREDAYKDYAVQFAGLASSGHSDDYYALLTDFNSSDDYESQIRSEGRSEFFPGGDSQTLHDYYLSNRIGDFEPWAWSSENARLFYQERRAASKRAFRRRTYAVAAAIANRVVAVFFAVKVSREMSQRQSAMQRGFHIEIGAPGYYPGGEFQTGVSIVRRF